MEPRFVHQENAAGTGGSYTGTTYFGIGTFVSARTFTNSAPDSNGIVTIMAVAAWVRGTGLYKHIRGKFTVSGTLDTKSGPLKIVLVGTETYLTVTAQEERTRRLVAWASQGARRRRTRLRASSIAFFYRLTSSSAANVPGVVASKTARSKRRPAQRAVAAHPGRPLPTSHGRGLVQRGSERGPIASSIRRWLQRLTGSHAPSRVRIPTVLRFSPAGVGPPRTVFASSSVRSGWDPESPLAYVSSSTVGGSTWQRSPLLRGGHPAPYDRLAVGERGRP